MTCMLKVLESPIIQCPLGNGVVIHLPGLFEEAVKNSQKGTGELRMFVMKTMKCFYYQSV